MKLYGVDLHYTFTISNNHNTSYIDVYRRRRKHPIAATGTINCSNIDSAGFEDEARPDSLCEISGSRRRSFVSEKACQLAAVFTEHHGKMCMKMSRRGAKSLCTGTLHI